MVNTLPVKQSHVKQLHVKQPPVKQVSTKPYIDTRQQILDTAREIILGKGFAAVGLNEILTSANVPKGSFYHYFKSKEQFGNALLEDYFDKYAQHLDAIFTGQGSSVTQLMHFFNNWLNSQTGEIIADKCLVVKLSAEVTDLSEEMRLTLKNGTENVIKHIEICIDEGIANKELPGHLNAADITQQIYAMWIGATLLTKVHHNRAGLDSAMRATKRLLSIE